MTDPEIHRHEIETRGARDRAERDPVRRERAARGRRVEQRGREPEEATVEHVRGDGVDQRRVDDVECQLRRMVPRGVIAEEPVQYVEVRHRRQWPVECEAVVAGHEELHDVERPSHVDVRGIGHHPVVVGGEERAGRVSVREDVKDRHDGDRARGRSQPAGAWRASCDRHRPLHSPRCHAERDRLLPDAHSRKRTALRCNRAGDPLVGARCRS